MLVNEKYFTTELTEEDRQKVLAVLGLEKLSYLFTEILNGMYLQVIEVQNKKPHASLSLNTKTQVEDHVKKTGLFKIELNSQDGKISEIPKNKKTLWECLFPFPLNNLAYSFTKNPLKTIHIEPAEFAEALRVFEESLTKLEQHLSQTEVGLVKLVGTGNGFYLLLHFVRGQRIRIGIPHELEDFIATFRGAAPSLSDLESYFGTRVSLTEIIIPEAETGILQLAELKLALDNAITSIRSSVALALPSESITRPEIQL